MNIRFRNIFLGIGSLLTIALLLLSDPDGGLVSNLPFGGATLSTLIVLVTSILFIGLLHLARKAYVDYIDLEQFFKKAIGTPEGAGLALIAIGLMMVSIALVIIAAQM